MPRVTELPSTLAPLVRRNAIEISPAAFDTKRLITAVHRTLAEEQARQQAETKPGGRSRRKRGGRPRRSPAAGRDASAAAGRDASPAAGRDASPAAGRPRSKPGSRPRCKPGNGPPNACEGRSAAARWPGRQRGGRLMRPLTGWPHRPCRAGHGRLCSVGYRQLRRCECAGEFSTCPARGRSSAPDGRGPGSVGNGAAALA
jgi:hypothetical protein